MNKPSTALTAMVTLSLAGALLLAGCGGDSKPGALNSVTPIGPTAASRPTPSVPTTRAPKTQDPNSDAALIAAVLAYLGASERAHDSLRTDEVKKTFANGCIVCERDVARVERWAKSGYTIVGGGSTWSRPTVSTRGTNGVTLVRVMGGGKASVLKDATGKTVESFPAFPPTEVYFQVRPVKNHALVIGIT